MKAQVGPFPLDVALCIFSPEARRTHRWHPERRCVCWIDRVLIDAEHESLGNARCSIAGHFAETNGRPRESAAPEPAKG